MKALDDSQLTMVSIPIRPCHYSSVNEISRIQCSNIPSLGKLVLAPGARLNPLLPWFLGILYYSANTNTVSSLVTWSVRICQQCRGLILDPGLWRFLAEGNGYSHQYCCLENPTDRRARRATVHKVTRVGHDLANKPPPIQSMFLT